MGCSPSKGKLFSKPEAPQKAVPSEAQQDIADGHPAEVEDTCLKNEEKNEEKENEPPLPIEEHHPEKTAADKNQQDIREVTVTPQETLGDVQSAKNKKTEKRKKNKGKRRYNEKQRRSSIIKTKVDFPPHMVRAHQAAYSFVNPNISKYETLLDLLDQAAQTQLSLQPMMSALVLRFEEINQALEEMAEEGELMLKQHGDYMALPSGMLGTSTDTANPPHPPPDLLQQLLQHSTEKMRLVGGSVQAAGDTTLEEAVEYFSSLSKLMVEKLQAKQVAEGRLTQVLVQVEAAAMRKANPEDSALHSEDSGIGGENESLTGSERHRRHRGSAGSGSCGSGGNSRSAFDNIHGNLPSLVGHNEDDEGDEEEEDEDDDEEYEDDESDSSGRKRSNSSPPDPSQALRYLHAVYFQDQQTAGKRPLTALTETRPEASSSSRCVNVMMELQRSQRDLDQKIKKMAELKELAGPHYNLYRAGLRRYSLNAGAEKGPMKTNQSVFSLPALAPQPPKRPTVRRLINTFSQGVDGRPGQSLANIPPHIKRPKKSGVLLLSDTVHGNEGALVINGNNNNNSWPDGKDDLDVDNLPPPPPEVLMDNSFQSSEGRPGNEEGLQEDSVRSLPVINQKAGISQRLKASIHNVEVLPNRASVRPRSIPVSPTPPAKQETVVGAEQQPDTDQDPETEKANCRYQQAHKIIHLQNAAESSGRGPSPLQARTGQRCDSNEFYEGEMSSCIPPVTAPPVSRVRLPPSCPSVRHRFPSPPVCRPQSTSRPPSRPSSPRTVTRATDTTTEEIIPSVSFRDARSVFCRNEDCVSSGGSVPPKRWGEASRGRLTTRTDSSTRRTQSEQRPSLSSHSELSKDGSLGRDPAITKHRLNRSLMTRDDTQLDPSA